MRHLWDDGFVKWRRMVVVIIRCLRPQTVVSSSAICCELWNSVSAKQQAERCVAVTFSGEKGGSLSFSNRVGDPATLSWTLQMHSHHYSHFYTLKRLIKMFLIFFANIRQRKNIWSVWVTQIESQTCLFHHFPRLSIEKARVMTRHQQRDGICGSCNKMLPWEISIGVRVSKGEMSRAADFYQYHLLAQKFHV